MSDAVIRVFDRTEELRKNKAKARIKFYIDRVGIDAFRQEVEEELTKEWARQSFDPTPLMEVPDEHLDAPVLQPVSRNGHRNGHHGPEYEHWLETNVRPQKQEGYNSVEVKLRLGDIEVQQFPMLARIARDYAGSRVRTTTEQNLLFRWVPKSTLPKLWSELREMGLAEAGAQEITDVVSCPGTDSCKLGITSSMGLGEAVGDTLREMAIEDPLVKSLHVKMSGCPNGCARHHIANIGFHGAATKGDGNQVPAYELFPRRQLWQQRARALRPARQDQGARQAGPPAGARHHLLLPGAARAGRALQPVRGPGGAPGPSKRWPASTGIQAR